MFPRMPLSRTLAEVDNEGVRVAVVKGSAYDLFLTRSLKNAQLVRMESFEECIDLLKKGEVAVARRRKAATCCGCKGASGHVRVLPDRFMVIEQAMAMPKGRDAATSLSEEFCGRCEGIGLRRTSAAEKRTRRGSGGASRSASTLSAAVQAPRLTLKYP